MALNGKTNPLEGVLNDYSKKTLPDKVKDAKLRLALLKENFEYRRFFEEHQDNISTIRSLSPRLNELTPDKDGDRYWEVSSQLLSAQMPLFRCFESFGINTYALRSPYRSFIENLDLLDPRKDLDEIPERILMALLQNLFHRPAIEQITLGNDDPEDGRVIKPFEALQRRGGLKPYERLLKIDLRLKKSQLLKEFGHLIELIYAWREYSELEQDQERLDSYSTWEPDKTRHRKETWKQLKVWKLRKQRKNFQDIGKALNMTEDAAKKAFYVIYEKTQGKPYDPDKLRKEIWSVKKSELQRACDSCPDREVCTILCPNILAYVDQDTLKHSKEKLLSDDSQIIKDHLSQKDSNS